MPNDLPILECLVNKLNYGILDQLPATSGHIKSKQQTFTLNTATENKKVAFTGMGTRFIVATARGPNH